MLIEAKAIILLDDVSKKIIKTSISSFGTAGYRFINSLNELNDEMVTDCNKLMVLEGFLIEKNSISDLELYKELYGLDIVFMGSTEYTDALQGIATCFEVDISVLTFEVLQGCLFGDRSVEDKNAKSYIDCTDTAEEVLNSRGSHSEEIQDLAESYLAVLDKIVFYRSEFDRIKKENSLLQVKSDKLLADRNKLLSGYKQILSETKKLNVSLRRYEEIITEDIYEKVRLQEFLDKPLVIYFKEYEDFVNLDCFLETLFNAFRVQERKSVKVLRLFDSATSRKITTLPGYYKVFRNRYKLSEVLSNDFIAKTGDYRRIVEKILMNEAGLDVFIIVDSKNYEDIILSGTPLQLNLCREIEHRDAYGLGPSSTIINEGEEDSELFWGKYDTGGMSTDEKFLYLSSRPAIKNIVNLSKVFAESI